MMIQQMQWISEGVQTSQRSTQQHNRGCNIADVNQCIKCYFPHTMKKPPWIILCFLFYSLSYMALQIQIISELGLGFDSGKQFSTVMTLTTT